jgi:hypothetical protein
VSADDMGAPGFMISTGCQQHLHKDTLGNAVHRCRIEES